MQLSSISLALTRLGWLWTPAQLFASGEQGVFYDVSDFATLFQDSAGTTPVTAVEQPVGLILDKRLGLVLGPEKLSLFAPVLYNTATPATYDTVTGMGTVYRVDSSNQSAVRIASLTSNTYYLVTVSNTSANQISVRQNTVNSVVANISAGATVSVYASTSTYTDIVIASNPNASSSTFTLVSVRELPGFHTTQATSTARALSKATGAAKWLDYDGVDDVHNTTFPSSLGSSCTVARANVGGAPTILTGQTIGTSYAASTDNAGLIIVNRALTAGETAAVVSYLTAKGAA